MAALLAMVEEIVLTPEGDRLAILLKGDLGRCWRLPALRNLKTGSAKYRWLRGHATAGTWGAGRRWPEPFTSTRGSPLPALLHRLTSGSGGCPQSRTRGSSLQTAGKVRSPATPPRARRA